MGKQKKPKVENKYWFDEWPMPTVFKVGELITIVSVVIGLGTWISEYQDRKEERISRAWTLLTTASPGNSGKVEAIEYLNSKEVWLRGIDLSCERMGGAWDRLENSCERPTYLSNVDLRKANLHFANLQGVLLAGSNLNGADFSGANLRGADLTYAELKRANLAEADLKNFRAISANLKKSILVASNLEEADLNSANLIGSSMRRANLKNADLGVANLESADLTYASLWNAELTNAHISGTDFSGAFGLESSNFDGAWARKGDRPKGLSGIQIEICVSNRFVYLGKPETGCFLTMME